MVVSLFLAMMHLRIVSVRRKIVHHYRSHGFNHLFALLCRAAAVTAAAGTGATITPVVVNDVERLRLRMIDG